MSMTQKDRILSLLWDGRQHSSSEMRDLTPKIVQAVTRVWELREEGYAITRMKMSPTNGADGADVAWYRWHLDCPKRAAFAEKYDFRMLEPVDPKQLAMQLGGG